MPKDCAKTAILVYTIRKKDQPGQALQNAIVKNKLPLII